MSTRGTINSKGLKNLLAHIISVRDFQLCLTPPRAPGKDETLSPAPFTSDLTASFDIFFKIKRLGHKEGPNCPDIRPVRALVKSVAGEWGLDLPSSPFRDEPLREESGCSNQWLCSVIPLGYSTACAYLRTTITNKQFQNDPYGIFFYRVNIKKERKEKKERGRQGRGGDGG